MLWNTTRFRALEKDCGLGRGGANERMRDTFVPISPEEDLLTPERAAKGDLIVKRNGKGYINGAVLIDRLIIKKLVYNGILEYHHEIYGVGFLELRAAFRSPWAARISAILLEQFGKGISISHATEIYQNVCRGIRGRGLEVIQFALEVEDELGEQIRRYDVGLYKEHFERLVGLMDNERERIYNETQQQIERRVVKK